MRTGFWEIFLVVILILILFGHAKIPEVMKNLANGINVFKKELKNSTQAAESVKKPVEKKKPAAVKKAVKKTK